MTQPNEKEAENGPPIEKTKAEEDEELSEEDQQLKENLDMMVERACDKDHGVAKMAVNAIAEEIRTATSSMTSVPKPLKFLRPHYDTLKNHFESLPSGSEVRGSLADVISVLGMTSAPEGIRETLQYKLQSETSDVTVWGHEYLRHLAGEIGAEYEERKAADPPKNTDDLMSLVGKIVPWQMTHNAEPEAIDLCLEVESLDLIIAAVDEPNCARTCLYLVSCASYLPEPDDKVVYRAAFDSYLKVKRATDALNVAFRVGDYKLISEAFASAADDLERKQMAYMLGENHVWLDLEEGECTISDDDLREELNGIMGNTKLSERYLALARDLDVMEAKIPDDIYKMHLVEGRGTSGPSVDSARANLAATFVNAFVNAGFGQDKMVTAAADEEGNDEAGEEGSGNSSSVHWIFRNKDHGKLSAAASLGMVLLWDVEGGLPQIDRFLYASDPNVVAGALLAVGIVASGVVDEVDPAFAILSDYLSREEASVRAGATLGLGIAYAGRCKQDVAELLLPTSMDPEVPMEQAALAALAVALSFAGAANGEAVEAILQGMMMRPEADLASHGGHMMALALGILFLGRQEAVEATIEVAKTLPEKASEYVSTTLQVFAYAGTGDVLKIQQLLATCGEHIEVEENETWKAAHQAVAALGLGLVACGEDLGSQMAHRALEHLLSYGDPHVRRGVPLALAILNVSNPEMPVMDTLSRLSHDTDAEVAMGAVLGLGIIGAGTNNARLAGILRQLSSYYFKDPTLLFLVRVAQGLSHAGKGLITMSPHHVGSGALSRPAVAGLMTILFCSLDAKQTIAGKLHYLLYCLVPAMRPRMLMTVDAKGSMLPVPVRVGQAVDVVAQAGRPKTITGFQTHSTPVLLATGERAELGTEKYIPVSTSLEGTVILKENPDYVDMQE